jgi:hypothetical protein
MIYDAEIQTYLGNTIKMRNTDEDLLMSQISDLIQEKVRFTIEVRPVNNTRLLQDYHTYGWPVWIVLKPNGEEHTFVHQNKARYFAKTNMGSKPLKVLQLGNTFRKPNGHGGMTTWEVSDFRGAYPDLIPTVAKEYHKNDTKEE